MNAINIRVNILKESKADILLCCTNQRISEMVTSIKNSYIFNNVYSFSPENHADQTTISMIKKALRNITYIKKIEKILPNKNAHYDEIFISGPGLKCISIYYYFKNKNKNLKLNLYEEGLFEYYLFKSKKNNARRIYSKLFYRRYYLDDCSCLYVYKPKLLTNHIKNVEIVQIPQINNGKNILLALNKVFDFKNSGIMEQCDYLYIDQQFPTEEENRLQKEIVRSIVLKHGSKKVAVKLHPRSDIHKYDGLDILCLRTTQTMEMLYLNGFRVRKKFISICSTAVFTPYLMFNSTPDIVLIYKLFNGITVEEELINTINRFVDLYPNGSAQVIESLEEI